MLNVILIVAVFIVGFFILLLIENNENKKHAERLEHFKEIVSNHVDLNTSTTIEGMKYLYLFIVDSVNRKVCYIDETILSVLSFDEIINVELIENGITLSKKSTMRTIGGTLVGGFLAGGAGAVVGGLSGNAKQTQKISEVQIRMRIRDLNNPVLVIKCFDAKTMAPDGKAIKQTGNGSHLYNAGREHAQRILDLVSVVIDDVDRNSGNIQSVSSKLMISVADEISKLADLREKGLLTQDEFEKQKTKLLSQS